MVQESEIAVYFGQLWERQDSAIPLGPMTVCYSDGTSPEPAKCHQNVDRWVEENEGYKPVRGWAIVSQTSFFLMLAAHSVVQSNRGFLVDITLSESHHFLPHIGNAEIFEDLKIRYAQVTLPFR